MRIFSNLDRSSVFLALIFAGFLVHFLWLQVVAEDAYITFRYAQNVAAGHGFVWNAGEAPVEGYTNFLWVVICAAVLALGGDIVLFSQIAGFLLACATLLIVYNWAQRFIGLGRETALIPVLLLAAAGPFATWAGSGMETTLFGFLLTLGCYFIVAYWVEEQRADLYRWAVVMVLCSMTRPEGVMVFCLLTASILVSDWSRMRESLRDFSGPVLLYLFLFGGYFLWRYSYFGWLLPNTFYAKTGGGTEQIARGLKHTVWFYLFFVAPLVVALLPLLGRVRWPQTGPLSQMLHRHAGLIVPLVVVAVYSAYIIVVGGDYMAMFRFFAPLTPMVYLLAGSVIGMLWSRGTSQTFASVGLAVCVGLTLLQSTPLEARLFPKIYNNHGTWRGVETERWHVNRLLLIGNYFESIRKDEEDSVATGGIGAIGYATRMKVIGLHGLVDAHIAHKEFKEGELGSGLPGHERGDLSYIFSKKPRYYMFTRQFSETPDEYYPSDLPEDVVEIAASEYEQTSVMLEDDVNGETGYFTYLRRIEE
ncbi:glycosyltransferase family 39 protein [Rhodobacteraceae bacterium NNCM2]|nr:glycosyltransferase family 39 protein [Coraliihabitans acroporae]